MRFVSLLVLCFIFAGCTYSRIGVNHETGQRNVFTMGLPCRVSDGVIEADNRIISIALDTIEVEK